MIAIVTQAWNEVVDKLISWFETGVSMLPNLVVALFVITLFWLLARTAHRAARKVTVRFSESLALANLFSTVAYLATMAIGVFVALGVMNLDKTVTSLLAGVGVVGLALGFAFQDLAANFMSGIFISVRRPFKNGDLIETHDYRGRVDGIDLRTTTLQVPDGRRVLLPNKEVLQNPIVNYSASGNRRVNLEVGVSYDDDLDQVEQVALQAVRDVPGRDPDRDVELFFTEFGGSSINLILRFWIPETSQKEYLKAHSEALRRVKKAFDAEGISIPFPIRTLDLESGREILNEVFSPPREPSREHSEVSH